MTMLKLSVLCLVSLLCCASLSAAESDVIASVEYFYAQDGTLIGRAVNGIRQNFEYDKRGQLLAVKDANGRDLERYTYDPAGNRLSKTVNGITTTYTYDEANQLKTSTVNGETTHYRYDAAGRLVQAGDKTYYYFGASDKVTDVRQGGKIIAQFDYFMDGQIASAKYPDREENFTWDGLALVQRNEVSYINEPYVTGGNPILSSRDGVIFNDMLGSTLNIGRQPVSMTSFGESEDAAAFFTGKPMISELGYSFLFRDYNPAQGKWTSSDSLGYPDGWNNLAYVNNGVMFFVDPRGTVLDIVGSDEFVTNVNAEIGVITSTPTGAMLIDQLQKSTNKHTIRQTSRGNYCRPKDRANAQNKIGTGSNIFFNPEASIRGWTRPSWAGLAHELLHSADYDLGVLDVSRNKDSGIKNAEIKACQETNRILLEKNDPTFKTRTRYNGKKLPDSAIRPIPRKQAE